MCQCLLLGLCGTRRFRDSHPFGLRGTGGFRDSLLLFGTNPRRRAGDNHEHCGDQSHRRPLQRHQSLLPREAVVLSLDQLLPQERVVRIGFIEQRQPEIEVSLPLRALRISQLGLRDADGSPFVPRPQFVRLLKAEQGARVVLVVVGLPGLLQIVLGPRRQENALGVRLIVADGRLQFLHVLIAVLRFGGHRLHGDVDQFAGLVSRRDLVARGRHQTLHRVLGDVRRIAGEDLVQDRTE